jgi:trehalose 6-phosphate phosphatase
VTPVDVVAARAFEALRDRPSALISDIDGTLSRIVSRPADAIVSERARRALREIATCLDLVAIITGRPNNVACAMVGVEEIEYMGSYALDAASVVRMAESDIGLIRDQADRLLTDLPCVTLEEKEVSFAFHYRNCAEPETVGAALLERLAPLASKGGARLLEGKRVVEVVPEALPDKDVAFVKLAADHQLRGAVFMGDDGADRAVFRAITGRREQGFDGLSVAVTDAETPPSVIQAADVTLAGVDEVEDFLEALLSRIKESVEWRQQTL